MLKAFGANIEIINNDKKQIKIVGQKELAKNIDVPNDLSVVLFL